MFAVESQAVGEIEAVKVELVGSGSWFLKQVSVRDVVGGVKKTFDYGEWVKSGSVVTLDGKAKLKTPSGVLSTAEAISVLANSMALAGNFGNGEVSAADLASAIQGSVVKDEEKDRVVWQEYLNNVLKKRGAEWRPLYTACAEQND